MVLPVLGSYKGSRRVVKVFVWLYVGFMGKVVSGVQVEV